jgi:hypothetical protein
MFDHPLQLLDALSLGILLQPRQRLALQILAQSLLQQGLDTLLLLELGGNSSSFSLDAAE